MHKFLGLNSGTIKGKGEKLSHSNQDTSSFSHIILSNLIILMREWKKNDELVRRNATWKCLGIFQMIKQKIYRKTMVFRRYSKKEKTAYISLFPRPLLNTNAPCPNHRKEGQSPRKSRQGWWHSWQSQLLGSTDRQINRAQRSGSLSYSINSQEIKDPNSKWKEGEWYLGNNTQGYACSCTRTQK